MPVILADFLVFIISLDISLVLLLLFQMLSTIVKYVVTLLVSMVGHLLRKFNFIWPSPKGDLIPFAGKFVLYDP